MKALTLRSSITKPSLITRSGFTTGRVGVAFLLAGLITTANWFIQGELTEADNTRANEIIKRVTDKKTVSVTDLQNYTQASELEGSLVQVKGELLDGRFVVKRSRGGQEGYIILAPFSVSRRQYQYDLSQKSLNEKYMLNLGWVPKQSKHTIRETAAVDVLEFDQLPEELASEEEPPAFLTVTAYVRRGEEQDILRGYRNWLRQKLFKYVDLPFLANMYCAANKSFNYIYLDRVAEEGSADAFPFPNTQEHYVDQMRQEIAYNNKRKQQLSYGVGIASFATAAITCLL